MAPEISPFWPRHPRFGALAIAALLLASRLMAQEARSPATPEELRALLLAHVTQARFTAALWGVKVVSFDSGKTVFEHNPQKLFSPASNSKLYTVALALDRLGTDYRIKTSLYAKTRPNRRGTLAGDLIIYGRGDPTINTRLHKGDIFQALEPLVTVLTNAGVQRINGDLVADASFLRGPEFGSGWTWEDLEYYYGAEISALTINDNVLAVSARPGGRVGAACKLALTLPTSCLTVSNRTQTTPAGTRRRLDFHRPINENVVYVAGTMPLDDAGYTTDVTVHKPASLFAAWFKEALTRHGIKVRGQTRALDWQDRQACPLDLSQLVELGCIQSPALADLAREVMKPSQNLYTDLLLGHVGESRRTAATPPGRTSEDLGILELGRFLDEAGIKGGEVLFEEGSGLSRNNLTTPNATVALLQYMNHHKAAAAYLASLPIAGVDGTLRNRMKGTPAEGNLRAKTGTLRWANSLSGHVTTKAGERLVFCLMLNRYYNADPLHTARVELDTLATLLAGFTGRTGD